jgi:parvulin-like peptidyl-prolyl isomerase
MKALLREPLLHFLALGALLFLFFEWRGGGTGPGSTRITITPGLVEHLASGFAKTWQRPPTEVELKGLIDEHVKEEIATREATAMGLDKDDAIIRRRLRQKMEFLVEDAVDQAPATDADLQAWMDKHAEAFRAEPSVALRQVYVSTERRGASAPADAGKLLALLRAAGPAAKAAALGDSSMLPAELPLGPLSEVSRAFGSEFAAKVDALAPGQWSGPIESPYGLHLVLVSDRVAAPRPALADVRPVVEREYLAERRRAQLQALYERLLKKYTVSIEMPKEDAQKQAAAGTPAGPGR